MSEKKVTRYLTVEDVAQVPTRFGNILGVIAAAMLRESGEYRYHCNGEHVTLKLKK